jgi:hypothetical protein
MFTPKTKRKRSLILVVLMSTLNFGTYSQCLWESRIVVSHKHAQIYTKIRWYWSCSWAHWILVHIWRAYENLVLWCLISTFKYIPKSADTGRAHEHTGFWYIYGVLMRNSYYDVSYKHAQIYTKIRWYWSCSWPHWILVYIWRAYENLVLWCLISTFKYTPKSADTGRAHEHTGFWHKYACLWESRLVVSHKHAQIHTKIRWYWSCSWPHWILVYIWRAYAWESRVVVSHKHVQIYTKIRWYWSCSWPHWILVHIWRAYENLVLWCLISTFKYTPKSLILVVLISTLDFGTYMAWLSQSRVVVSHISTLKYIPK